MPLPIDNHCPYGCQEIDLDGDTGYCKHLVGFANDPRPGQTAELLERVERFDRNGNRFYTFARVTGRKLFRITKECKPVNPEIVVQSMGHKVSQKVYKWLTWRIYHPHYENKHFMPPPEAAPEELPTFFDLPNTLVTAQSGPGIFGIEPTVKG